ncbi:tetratricopeptide repeat protein [Cystobacter fuscus]|uniref:tetratricopeptide repeat protein n=1 Tax=Cystobacter fuscus TaxID=43 RepID=UPI0037BF63EC
MRLVLLLWTALLLTPLAAHAKGPSAKELVKQAERLYEQKKYVEAAEALEKANEQAPDSRLIYNIARAYDQAGRAREAIGYYEQYMTDGEDAQLRKRARSAVDRLRLQQQKEEAAAAAAEAERKRLQEEAEAAQRRMEAERVAARQAEEANQLRLEEAHRDALAERKRTQITSFALGGLAVASAGVGVVFGVQAANARANFNTAQDLDTKLAARTSTRNNALLADIGYGVGIVSAVAAVLLYPRQPAPVAGHARLISAPRGSGAGVEVSF